MSENNHSEETEAKKKAKKAKKAVKRTVKKTVKKKTSTKKSALKKNMEARVEDYLYNPDTDEKIEPPKEEPQTEKPAPEENTKKTKKTKKKIKSRIPLPARIALIFFKGLGFLLLGVIMLVFLALIAVKAFLTPGRVERLATQNFNKLSNATLSLDVKEFNPYAGFVIDNIKITNPEGFGEGDFLTIDKMALDYGFFKIFTGDISFREIGIYKSSVRLVQKNGEWNAAKLMKPTEKKEKPEKEKKKSGEMPEDISLPISVNFLFNFILEDLNVVVDGESFDTSLKDFDTAINIDIPPFKKVPLNANAVKLIRNLSIKINPDEKLKVGLKSETVSVAPPLLFTFDLSYNGEDEKNTKFYSIFKAGTYETPIAFQGANLKPLTLRADYDLYYDPIADYLKINSFGVTFGSDRWIDLGGKIESLAESQNIDIKMIASSIKLDELYPYFLAVTNNDSIVFAGDISLMPLEIKGTPTEINVDGALNLSKIYASVPDFNIRIPNFTFDYNIDYKDGNVFAATGLSMPKFRYKLGRYSSGLNTLMLKLNAKTAEQFKAFALTKFDLDYTDPKSGLNAVAIDMTADADISGDTVAKVNMSNLEFRVAPLKNMLPSSIGDSLSSVPLKKPVYMNLNANYKGSGTVHSGNFLLGVKLPDYDVYDLKLSADANMDMESRLAKWNYVKLWSPSYGVNVKSNGTINLTPTDDGQPFSDSNIALNVQFLQKKLRTMYDTWQLKGEVKLNTYFKGNLKNGKAKGNIDINHFFVQNKNENLLLNLDDLNLDFPFEYSLASTFTGKEKTSVDKEKVISNDYFKTAENFTIASVRAKHPSRQEAYEYMKDFRSTMFFKENAFEIEKLKCTVMNGSIYMKDTFFYIADLNTDNMEYNLEFDATNVDIGKLDDPDKDTNESELSLTTKLSGKGVNVTDNLTTSGYIILYKLEDKFANQLMTALSKDQGESKLGASQVFVDNAMNLEKFEFFIEKGNVYATVKLEKKLITKLTASGVEGDEIKYERMPIQEFLSNMKSEE